MLDWLIAIIKYVGNMVLLGFICLIFLFACIAVLGVFIGLLASLGIIYGLAKIVVLLIICFVIGVLISESKL